jgi:hypothetical protein
MNYFDQMVNLPDGSTKPFGKLTPKDLEACATYLQETAELSDLLMRLHTEAVTLIQESGLDNLGQVIAAGGKAGRRAALLLMEADSAERDFERRIDISLPEIRASDPPTA